MQRNTIRQLLKIPAYKVVKVESEDSEIHVWLQPHKRNRAICSGCGKVHGGYYHSVKEVVVRDLSLSGMTRRTKDAQRRTTKTHKTDSN